MPSAPFRLLPSPYCDQRPAGTVIDLLVVHAISLPPGCFGGTEIDDLFLGRLAERDWGPVVPAFYEDVAALRVSAHFLIDRLGRITQYVPIAARAWHAGQSLWQGRPRCNDFSIGVELEGDAHTLFEPVQYQHLASLIKTLHAGLRRRGWGALPQHRIVGHEQIAPGRKWDPGPFFEWEILWGMLRTAKTGKWPLVWRH
ncbi:MAG: 1,6-anhydro-N-acetylmuramyl-L-alanine amidase AmpD [Magnetococcales bacterium]|nr:1,6-anhydro-N-acetylmuramyl-L-alanine amidase AmpD [Magnetococcales bacterium]